MDEAEFWKQQEAEYTVVIRQIVSDLEPELVRQLKQFELAFQQTKGLAVRCMEALNRAGSCLHPNLRQQIFLNRLRSQAKSTIYHVIKPHTCRKRGSAS
ncbi:MAG: DUF2935 domain-containing protein [bacterium]